MGGRVGREPAERLLPLPLRADRPAAPVLVREDDGVDEPLEEVALLRSGRTPRRLERLVRLEERAAPGEAQAVLVIV